MSTLHHMRGPVNWHGTNKPYLCGAMSGTGTTSATVTCPDCRRILAGNSGLGEPEHLLRNHPGGGITYLCGITRAANASIDPAHVTCEDCLTIMAGGSEPRPLHTPPYMNEDNNGVFIFHDVDHNNAQHDWQQGLPTLEVVPQTTGNVEITLDATLFTLSHCDRADLIRALLHDFHYSPERFGPTDE